MTKIPSATMSISKNAQMIVPALMMWSVHLKKNTCTGSSIEDPNCLRLRAQSSSKWTILTSLSKRRSQGLVQFGLFQMNRGLLL